MWALTTRFDVFVLHYLFEIPFWWCREQLNHIAHLIEADEGVHCFTPSVLLSVRAIRQSVLPIAKRSSPHRSMISRAGIDTMNCSAPVNCSRPSLNGVLFITFLLIDIYPWVPVQGF